MSTVALCNFHFMAILEIRDDAEENPQTVTSEESNDSFTAVFIAVTAAKERDIAGAGL